MFVSNRTNFTAHGINATAYEPVTFGGPPIYFVNMKRESGYYEVEFTSYRKAWEGAWLGTFEKGKIIRIPFLVQEPGTTVGIGNANVTIDKFTWWEPGRDVTINAYNLTNEYGLAMVPVDTTNIPTGQYLVSYKVKFNEREKKVEEKWRMPGLEIRKFIVDAEVGEVGSITTHKIANNSGLSVLYGVELLPMGNVSARLVAEGIFEIGYPFNIENEYYYNATNGSYHTSPSADTASFIANNSINLTIRGINTTCNFTSFNSTADPPYASVKIDALETLLDGNLDNGEWKVPEERKEWEAMTSRLSYRDYDVYCYNDVNETEPEKLWGWCPTLDRVFVTNGTWNATYRIGENIAVFDDEYVGLATRWGGKVIFGNSTATYGIYPFDEWAPDGDIYYVGTFTEKDINVDLNYNGTIDEDITYYIMLLDQYPNGRFEVTEGVFDDDKDFMWGWNRTIWQPIDLYSEEGGFEERYIPLGYIYGWPFAVPVVTYSDDYYYANLTTLKPMWWEPFGLDENVTIYINARLFSGLPLPEGNVSLDRLIVIFKYSFTAMPGYTGDSSSPVAPIPPAAPEVYTIPNLTYPIEKGTGVWMINYSVIAEETGDFDLGVFVVKLNITDNEGNFEIVERHFSMMNKTKMEEIWGAPIPIY